MSAFNRPGNNSGDVSISVNITTNKQQLQASTRDVQAFKKTLAEAFAPDNAATQKARAAFAQQRVEIDKNRAAAERVNDVYRSWGKVLGEIEQRNLVAHISAELNDAVKNGKDLTEALRQAKEQLQAIGATENEVRRVVESAAVAAQTAGSGRSTGSQALQSFGREARLSVPAFPIPGTRLSTEFLFRVSEVMGRLGLDLKQLAIAGGAASFAIVGIALALKNFEDTLRPVADLLNGIVFGRGEAAGILASSEPQELLDKIEEKQKALDRDRAERASIQADIDTQRRNAGLPEPGATQLPEGKNALQLILPQIAFDLATKDQKARVDKLTGSITENENTLAGLITDQDKATKAVEEAELAKRLEQIADQKLLASLQAQLQVRTLDAEAIRSNIAAMEAEKKATEGLIAAGGLSADAVEQLWDRLRQLNEQLPVFEAALPSAERLERARKAQEDQQEAEQALVQLSERVLQIREQGEQRMVAIAEQGRKQIEAAEQRLTDARTKLVEFDAEQAAKRDQVNADFMEADLERVADFRKRERKVQRDADKERLRDLEDHNDNLLDAERNNDVSAFLAEQRRFKKEQDRKQQDQQTELGDRIDDLNAEREKAREVRDERIAGLDADAAKRRETLQAEIADRDAALQAVKNEIAQKQVAEENAIRKSLKALTDGLDTSASHMVQTVQNAFATLETAGIQTTNGIINSLLQRANSFNIQQSIQAGTPGASRSIPLVNLTGAPGIRAFARGGVVDKPTLAIVGDAGPGMSEAIIPFRTGGVGPGLGPQTIQFIHNGNIVADDKMTRAEFRKEMTGVIRGFWKGAAMAQGMSA